MPVVEQGNLSERHDLICDIMMLYKIDKVGTMLYLFGYTSSCGNGVELADKYTRAQHISIYSKVGKSEAKSIIKKDVIVAGTME